MRRVNRRQTTCPVQLSTFSSKLSTTRSSGTAATFSTTNRKALVGTWTRCGTLPTNSARRIKRWPVSVWVGSKSLKQIRICNPENKLCQGRRRRTLSEAAQRLTTSLTKQIDAFQRATKAIGSSKLQHTNGVAARLEPNFLTKRRALLLRKIRRPRSSRN